VTRLERIVRKWQKRLQLDDWEITVEYNDDPEWPNWGIIAPVPGRKEAVLVLSTLAPPERREFIVVHELCHLLVLPLNTMADSWAGSIPAKSRPTHTQQWTEVTEQVVNSLTKLYLAEPPSPIRIIE